VSITADVWMADKMKKGFLGMTAHWIKVEVVSENEECWTLKSAVIGFQMISDGHDRKNLGHYIVGITDRVGITGHNSFKVSAHMHRPFLHQQSNFTCHPALHHDAQQCIK